MALFMSLLESSFSVLVYISPPDAEQFIQDIKDEHFPELFSFFSALTTVAIIFAIYRTWAANR